MSNPKPALAKSVCPLLLATLLAACVGTELDPPANHPGNPRAPSGKLTAVSALRSDFDASRGQPPERSDPHAGHTHGSRENAASVRYTCPMHPEIESKEPGTCPKCGMKLVPKKDNP